MKHCMIHCMKRCINHCMNHCITCCRKHCIKHCIKHCMIHWDMLCMLTVRRRVVMVAHWPQRKLQCNHIRKLLLSPAILSPACASAGLALNRPATSITAVEFTGEGQMHLNALHLAEVFADDSNFRQQAMERLAAPLAQVLCLASQDFASAWLSGEQHLMQVILQGRLPHCYGSLLTLTCQVCL